MCVSNAVVAHSQLFHGPCVAVTFWHCFLQERVCLAIFPIKASLFLVLLGPWDDLQKGISITNVSASEIMPCFGEGR